MAARTRFQLDIWAWKTAIPFKSYIRLMRNHDVTWKQYRLLLVRRESADPE